MISLQAYTSLKPGTSARMLSANSKVPDLFHFFLLSIGNSTGVSEMRAMRWYRNGYDDDNARFLFCMKSSQHEEIKLLKGKW